MSNVDDRNVELWRKQQEDRARVLEGDQPESTLKGGDGGGTSGGDMESRVAKLEAYVEVARDDLREIRGDMKAVIAKLGTIPTKSDLDSWKWQWLLASVAIFAVIIGSIIGGLAWLAD